jgi:hypothetical protein
MITANWNGSKKGRKEKIGNEKLLEKQKNCKRKYA